MSKYNNLKKFWKGKKVFLTGHTGFKGCWFSVFLNLLGAKVSGYALKPNNKLDFYNLIKLNKQIYSSKIGDIRNYNKLKNSILKFSPDFIVHMAAQPLVSESYIDPKSTYETNIMGTVNILNIINEINYKKSTLIVTTDKVYSNKNKIKYFKEEDILGGADPYSNSKSCAELIVNSFNKSFFNDKKIYVVTARAGNIIGGGDFSRDRIIPDYFRSILDKKKLMLRSPNSIRPWQHVTEVIFGYILLLMKLHKRGIEPGESFNFGPKISNNHTVHEIIKLINKNFNNSVKIVKKKTKQNYKESKILMLNSNKSKKLLNWEPQYNLKQSIKLTSDWYKTLLDNNKNILKFTQCQIKDYLKLYK